MLGQKEESKTIVKKIQSEEINQKVLAKERRLKRYSDRQNNERTFNKQVVGNVRKHAKNRMTRKQYNFRAKYRNEELSKSINNMGEELEEGPKAKIQLNSLRATLQKVPT